MNAMQIRVVRFVRTLLEVTPVAVILDFDWLEPLSVKTSTSVLPLSVRVTRFVQIPLEVIDVPVMKDSFLTQQQEGHATVRQGQDITNST